jgi:serine/threonine-protein kinase RsbW
MGEKREFTVAGRYDQVSVACDFVAEGAEEAGFNLDEVFRIQLACDEACTNIIQHAYGGEDVGKISVTWQLDNKTFTIILRDKGRSFDLDAIPQPDLPMKPDDIDELKIGGLGVHFMRSLMDEIHFDSDHSKGNTLIMVKYLPTDQKE